MQIIIVSNDRSLSETVLPLIDDMIITNHCPNLELYSYQTLPPGSLSRLDKKGCYYFLFDIRKTEQAVSQIRHLFKTFPYTQLGIISDNDLSYAYLANRLFSIHGCINLNRSRWPQELETLLHSLSGQVSSVQQSLVISCKSEDYIIPYPSIFYIETLKGTHYCNVTGDISAPTFRGNIYETIWLLDSRFAVVRSSTIANLSRVTKINRREKLLIFDKEIRCSYSERFYQDIAGRIKGERR